MGTKLMLVGALLGLAATGTAQAHVPMTDVHAPHVVSGAAQLSSERWFGIEAREHEWGVAGDAWLARTPTAPRTRIALDCLHIEWHLPVYPIPPYLPYHVARASGTTADGTRYYIAAYDVVPRPVGLGDRLILSTEQGTGACGGSLEAGSPFETGEIMIGP